MILKKEDFVCVICKSLLFDPYMTDVCQHSYCKQCLPVSTINGCPTCRARYTKTIPNIYFRNILNTHFAEEIETCNFCGKQHEYRLMAECFKKKQESENKVLAIQTQRVQHEAMRAVPNPNQNNWWSVFTSRLRQQQQSHVINNQPTVWYMSSQSPAGEWYMSSQSPAGELHLQSNVNSGNIEYIFNEQHQVWHMSNEDPAIIAEQFKIIPPPPVTPLPENSKTTRYVDHLNVSTTNNFTWEKK